MNREHLSRDIEQELTRQALRKDGPLIDVTLRTTCQDGRVCPPVRGKALIDTGADRTAIEVSKVPGAQPTGTYDAMGVTASAISLPTYSVRLDFDKGLGGVDLERVAGTPHLEAQGLVALIGRDVLERSRLVYDGPSGSYMLSTPGGSERIEATTSKAPLVAVGMALVLGAAAAWIMMPAPSCPVVS